MDEVKLSEDEWNNFKIRMYFHKKEMLYPLKQDVRLLIQEKAKAMAEEKQVFISSYLQDLHIYLSAIPGLCVPGLKLVKDREFDDSKFCRIVEDPLLYQQGTKQLFYKCKRNFTIGRVCLDLQYYKPICLSFRHDELILTPKSLLDYGLVHQLVCLDPNQITNFGRKLVLSLMQGFKMNKKSAEAIIISKAPEWISNGCLLPAQHNISLHYQNRRPTLLSCLLDHTDLCAEPIKNQIKYWRARIISYDFEARKSILYQPNPLLRILSYLMNIVGIIFSLNFH